jgi:hypothetical protein
MNNLKRERNLLCLADFLESFNLHESDIPELIFRISTREGDMLAKLRNPQRDDKALVADIYSTDNLDQFKNSQIVLHTIVCRNFPKIFVP